MKSTSAIADIFKREGVDHLFCFPGKSVDRCRRRSRDPTDHGLHGAHRDRDGGWLHAGHQWPAYRGLCRPARAGDRKYLWGRCSGLFRFDSDPLLCREARPQNRLSTPPNFDPVLNYQHIGKWVSRINQAERIPEILRRAFTHLRTGRPGPVMLELPQDVAAAEVEEPILSHTNR